MSEILYGAKRAAGTIVQATTPSLDFTVAGVDLTDCKVQVYFKRREAVVICASDDDGRVTVSYDSGTDVTTLSVQLTQEETLSMAEGDTEIQAHWIDASGNADATFPPVVVKVGRILYPHEIVFGGE